MDPSWAERIDHELDRALAGQLVRSNLLLVVATLVVTAAVAVAVPAAVQDDTANWARIATGALVGATAFLAALVYLAHELYDIDPVKQLDAALSAHLDADGLRDLLIREKTFAYLVTEVGLERARVLLYAEVVVGLSAVASGVGLLSG